MASRKVLEEAMVAEVEEKGLLKKGAKAGVAMEVCDGQESREGARRQLLYAARRQACCAICKGLFSDNAMVSRKACVVDPQLAFRRWLPSLGK